MTLPGSAADVLADHVLFEIESIDRMYLNLYQPRLQHGAGIAAFFVGHRGYRFASSALMAPMTAAFTADISHFIAARGLDLVRFAPGQRKDQVTAGYLQRAELDDRGLVPAQVLYVGVAQEKQKVFRTSKRRNPVTGATYPWLVPGSGVINQYYFYCVDEDFGPVCVKFSGYFPYTGRLILNGNEYAKRQAAKAGIGFVPLDNAFAAVDDVAAVQAICDGLDEEKITALAARLLAILPYPFTAGDTAAGYRYELSVLQAEFSLTQMLDAPVTGRIFFDQLIRDNLDIGRPDRVGLIFGRRIQRGRKRPAPGRFRTRVITDGVTPSLHVDYKNSKIKQYHKLGKALRTETTINDTAKAHTFESTCARWRLKFTGWRAGCLGPGRRRRAGRRRGPCRGPRRRAWGPGWRRDRQAGSPAGCGFRCRPDPAPGPGTGPMPRCAGSWCES